MISPTLLAANAVTKLQQSLVEQFRMLPLSEGAKEKILGGNYARVFREVVGT